jgi:hypothetical protein
MHDPAEAPQRIHGTRTTIRFQRAWTLDHAFVTAPIALRLVSYVASFSGQPGAVSRHAARVCEPRLKAQHASVLIRHLHRHAMRSKRSAQCGAGMVWIFHMPNNVRRVFETVATVRRNFEIDSVRLLAPHRTAPWVP